ncbi:uncharacterized protein H6S33_003378 [Morchella sextelata]|uniref:uncharacterized protein n=1 Tax=Morchella sextelata TaxID=1174677 RepID=UPI001D051C28|nr:uncharacterized protein H6S33_003378 [Morchella sextelata]KAH0606544.1 hypothetical protein H6S33_003378 [Morchella sextelata]
MEKMFSTDPHIPLSPTAYNHCRVELTLQQQSETSIDDFGGRDMHRANGTLGTSSGPSGSISNVGARAAKANCDSERPHFPLEQHGSGEMITFIPPTALCIALNIAAAMSPLEPWPEYLPRGRRGGSETRAPCQWLITLTGHYRHANRGRQNNRLVSGVRLSVVPTVALEYIRDQGASSQLAMC